MEQSKIAVPVLANSRMTNGYLFGLAVSVAGVIAVNYAFTYPYGAIDFPLSGYPLTFLTFLVVSAFTRAMTAQVKQQDLLRDEASGLSGRWKIGCP